jgi:hypothetical protein
MLQASSLETSSHLDPPAFIIKPDERFMVAPQPYFISTFSDDKSMRQLSALDTCNEHHALWPPSYNATVAPAMIQIQSMSLLASEHVVAPALFGCLNRLIELPSRTDIDRITMFEELQRLPFVFSCTLPSELLANRIRYSGFHPVSFPLSSKLD